MDTRDQAKFYHLKAAYPGYPDEYLKEWAIWHDGPPAECTVRYTAWLASLSKSQRRNYEAGRSIYGSARYGARNK